MREVLGSIPGTALGGPPQFAAPRQRGDGLKVAVSDVIDLRQVASSKVD